MDLQEAASSKGPLPRAFSARREPILRAISAFGAIKARRTRRCKHSAVSLVCPGWLFQKNESRRFAGFVTFLTGGDLVRATDPHHYMDVPFESRLSSNAGMIKYFEREDFLHAFSQSFFLSLYPGPIMALVSVNRPGGVHAQLNAALARVSAGASIPKATVGPADTAALPIDLDNRPAHEKLLRLNRNEGKVDIKSLVSAFSPSEWRGLISKLKRYYAQDYACFGG